MTKYQSPSVVLRKRGIWGCLAILSMSLLSITGCSILGPVKTPPANNYTLNLPETGKARTAGQGRTLLVAAPVASPGYDTANMIYMIRPYELSSYANNHWVSPPAEILAPLMEQKLHNSGCFRAVASAPFTGITDLTLDTQLLVLRQEFIDNISQVRLVLLATIVDSATQHVVAQRRFESVVPTLQANPYSGVIAANQAAATVMRKLTTFVCHYGN